MRLIRIIVSKTGSFSEFDTRRISKISLTFKYIPLTF